MARLDGCAPGRHVLPHPAGGLDEKLLRYECAEHRPTEILKTLPEGRAWLVAVLGAYTDAQLETKAHELAGRNGVVLEGERAERLSKVREAGLATTARTPNGPDAWPGWEDSAVEPDRLGDYLRAPQDLLDGQARGELLHIMYGDDVVEAFAEFKAIFDPGNRMNPGKLVHGWRSEAVNDALDLCLACKGLQERLPGLGRHGHLQGRVPLAPLRRTRPARRPLLARLAAGGRPDRRARSGRRQRRGPSAVGQAAGRGGSAAYPVFRSDLGELFGRDQDADRLARQTHTLAELLIDRAPDFRPRLPGGQVEAIVQRHCHQHAVLGAGADQQLMDAVGLKASDPDSGCCGLAGNFGMTPAHRDVSLACAEQALLPAVRDATPDTLIMADGDRHAH
jgi:hypothetical protein